MTGLQFIRVRIFVALFVCVLAIAPLSSNAQCAMCTLNAENSTKEGNTQGNGLNSGILFLLSMPFIIAGELACCGTLSFDVRAKTGFRLH